jgi:hypothetical protein
LTVWIERHRLARFVAIAAIAAICLVGLSSPSSIGAQSAIGGSSSSAGCPRIIVYFSRGSGQSIAGVKDPGVSGGGRGLDNPGFQLYNALVARFGKNAVGSMANGYPAILVRFRPRFPAKYFVSVAEGVTSATRNISDLTLLCQKSWLVLAGYSQGAQVTRTVLSKLNGRQQTHIAAVVLFGDPYFMPTEPNVTAFPGFNPEHRGVLRQFKPARATPIGAAYSGRVLSWCHALDVICQGVHGRENRGAEHRTYWQDAPTAAEAVAGRLARLPHNPPSDLQRRPSRYRIVGTCNTGTCALAEWSGPGIASFRMVGSLHEGQAVNILCQAPGEVVAGQNGGSSSIWDRLDSGAFVSDYYISTPNVGTYSPPLPLCKSLDVVER